jgi:hypothetical protein
MSVASPPAAPGRRVAVSPASRDSGRPSRVDFLIGTATPETVIPVSAQAEASGVPCVLDHLPVRLPGPPHPPSRG